LEARASAGSEASCHRIFLLPVNNNRDKSLDLRIKFNDLKNKSRTDRIGAESPINGRLAAI
jgi:hypothetical protein